MNIPSSNGNNNNTTTTTVATLPSPDDLAGNIAGQTLNDLPPHAVPLAWDEAAKQTEASKQYRSILMEKRPPFRATQDLAIKNRIVDEATALVLNAGLRIVRPPTPKLKGPYKYQDFKKTRKTIRTFLHDGKERAKRVAASLEKRAEKAKKKKMAAAAAAAGTMMMRASTEANRLTEAQGLELDQKPAALPAMMMATSDRHNADAVNLKTAAVPSPAPLPKSSSVEGMAAPPSIFLLPRDQADDIPPMDEEEQEEDAPQLAPSAQPTAMPFHQQPDLWEEMPYDMPYDELVSIVLVGTAENDGGLFSFVVPEGS